MQHLLEKERLFYSLKELIKSMEAIRMGKRTIISVQGQPYLYLFSSRWHKGIITDVYEFETEEGEVETRYAGRHVKRENEIRYPYRGYRQHFHDINIKDIRLPPNPMDALLAFNKLSQ